MIPDSRWTQAELSLLGLLAEGYTVRRLPTGAYPPLGGPVAEPCLMATCVERPSPRSITRHWVVPVTAVESGNAGLFLDGANLSVIV